MSVCVLFLKIASFGWSVSVHLSVHLLGYCMMGHDVDLIYLVKKVLHLLYLYMEAVGMPLELKCTVETNVTRLS